LAAQRKPAKTTDIAATVIRQAERKTNLAKNAQKDYGEGIKDDNARKTTESQSLG